MLHLWNGMGAPGTMFHTLLGYIVAEEMSDIHGSKMCVAGLHPSICAGWWWTFQRFQHCCLTVECRSGRKAAERQHAWRDEVVAVTLCVAYAAINVNYIDSDLASRLHARTLSSSLESIKTTTTTLS
jgi:hypothetical protein